MKFVVLNTAELEEWRDELLREIRTVIQEELPSHNNGSTWLTEKETQEYLNVGRTTLYKLRRDGVIPFSQRGRKILYRKADLDDFLMRNHTTK